MIDVTFGPADSCVKNWQLTGEACPQEVIDFLHTLHDGSDSDLDNFEVDSMVFGIPNEAADGELYKSGVIDKVNFTDEHIWFPSSPAIWTPYNTIRSIVKQLQLDEGTTFYDLGCGYGRLPIYAGVNSPATCKGLELVPERADLAQQTVERLGLENVEISEGNANSFDYSDGDIFYMYAPFSGSTFKAVLERLRSIAKEKTITVVARGKEREFAYAPWLHFKERVLATREGGFVDGVGVYKSEL